MRLVSLHENDGDSILVTQPIIVGVEVLEGNCDVHTYTVWSAGLWPVADDRVIDLL